MQVKGYPDPQLQWFKNNQLLNLGGRINLFGGLDGWYTLQIKELCLEDQGEYTFIAENEFGEATCVVNLQDVGISSPNGNLADPNSFSPASIGPPTARSSMINSTAVPTNPGWHNDLSGVRVSRIAEGPDNSHVPMCR